MRATASVLIDRLPTAVFDFITDPRKAAYWHGQVLRFEPIAGTPGTVGAQTRWVFGGNGYEVEAIETIVAHERPGLFASQHQLTRFLKGPPATAGRPALGPEALEQHFRMAYGQGTPGGLLAVEVLPHGETGAEVTMRVDSNLKGSARISSWIGRLLGRSPLRDRLQLLKDRIEAETF